MANSFQLFLRASIMIVTMVAIPLIAMFGKQIPEFFEAIWNGHERAGRMASASDRACAVEAATTTSPMSERFASQQRRSDLDEAPKFVPNNDASNSTRPDAGGPSTLAMPAPRMLPPDAVKNAEPLSMAPPSGGRAAGLNPGLMNSLPPNSMAMNVAPPTQKISDPFVRPTVGTGDAAAPAGVDPLVIAQNKLRALGVGYFKLETTGEAEVRYRCYCQVKSGDGPVQDFSAVQAVPLAAIHDVTGQIERWQATLKDRVGQGATKLR